MGPALCLLSAACFGALAIFGKLAYAAGVSPGTLVLVRFGLAAALLAVLLLVRPGLRCGRPGVPAVGVVAVALGLGAVGYATQASLYFAALERMDAPLLSLIFYTYPLLVTVTGVVLGRDRLTARRVAALTAASCGTLLVLAGAGASSADPLGLVLGFGTAVTYTVYILVADAVVHRLPPVVLAALVMTGATLSLTARAFVAGGVDLDVGVEGWFWLACIAVVSTVLATLAFFAGLRRIGPSTAAILSTFEPVVTTALAAFALDEFLTPVQLAGALLVLSSVVVLQVRLTARPHPAWSGSGGGVVPVGSARAVAASRRSAAVPVEDHDGRVVAEVAARGAQHRGAELVDHFAGMQVAGLGEGGGDVDLSGVAFEHAVGDEDQAVTRGQRERLHPERSARA